MEQQRVVVTCQSKVDSLKWVELIQQATKLHRQSHFNGGNNSVSASSKPYEELTHWIREKILSGNFRTFSTVPRIKLGPCETVKRRFRRARKVEGKLFSSFEGFFGGSRSSSNEIFVLLPGKEEQDLRRHSEKVATTASSAATVELINSMVLEIDSATTSNSCSDSRINQDEQKKSWNHLGVVANEDDDLMLQRSRSFNSPSTKKKASPENKFNTVCHQRPRASSDAAVSYYLTTLTAESNLGGDGEMHWIESSSGSEQSLLYHPFCAPTLLDYDEIRTAAAMEGWECESRRLNGFSHSLSPRNVSRFSPKMNQRKQLEIVPMPPESAGKVASLESTPLPSSSSSSTGAQTVKTETRVYLGVDPDRGDDDDGGLGRRRLCCTLSKRRSKKIQEFCLPEAPVYKSTLYAHWSMKCVLPTWEEVKEHDECQKRTGK